MSIFFKELKIGNLVLDNRIIYAPMTRSRANDEGVQPEFTVDYYTQRASAGLLVTEATNVSPMAKGYVRTPGIYAEDQIESWRKVTDSVHAKGGKIFMQIFHTGRIALPDFLPEGVEKPVAPSAVKANGQNYTDDGMKDFVEPREMTTGEVKETVQDFANAAKNAIAAGFDGVEIHGANGYLVQQFLSTNVNKRSDEYGGSIENRARFLFEVLDAMIAEIGGGRTSLRLSPGGEFNDIKEDDAEELYDYVINELNKRDFAYLHIGTFDQNRNWHPVIRPKFEGVYFAGVGFTKETGEKLLAAGGADAIVFGKLFLANPDLPKRFKIDAELNEWDNSTFYTPGTKGYIDYPTLDEAKAAN
ncbi:MAG: alkene reductase [Pyrinomonadaceae bacterium]|nr:alkene reductase [Pyrinomonadaceae bacterium]